ncbi:MAG: GNAT family N-acetyltransferase [Acidobacteriia bacterium]|nr:GNAT family N-acetyltransferase [Terriglobia bacterium]
MKYRIRPCRTLDELATCVKIQKEIWGYSEQELYPLRLFINLGKIGGHVLGGFTSQGALVGFVASMPAWRGRERYYHSLSLGVVRGHENQGLGRALKLSHRRAALSAGINRIEWTFDPLRAKNAYLNIYRLGAIVRHYLPDYYGHVDSRFQRGLPSDRLVAEWHLNSARARRALTGKPSRSSPRRPAAEVIIPPDIDALLETRPAEALALQGAIRKQLQKHFRRGLAITGFFYDGKSARYLLDPYED